MSFKALLGNERIKRILKSFVVSRKFPNALLFVGKDGIGKKTFAIEFVRALFCSNQVDGESCLVCNSCKRIQINLPSDKEAFRSVIFSEHTDFGIVLPHDKTISVEAIRELEIEVRAKSPREALIRVFIIDEAEKMTPAAFNALLKTLEEPRDTSHIILISSCPNQIPSTVLSRCQILSFAPMDFDEMASFLAREKGISIEKAKIIARCAGSFSKALATDTDTLFEKRELAIQVLRLSLEANYLELLRLSGQISEDLEDFLELTQSIIHDIWLVKTGAYDKVLNCDLEEELRDIASKVKVGTIMTWQDEIEELREKMMFNLNKRIACDGLFMRMSYGS